MSTIINNPGDKTSDSGAGLGLLVGLVIAALAVVLFFIYGVPGFNRTEPAANPNPTGNTTEIDVELPAPSIEPNPAADTESQ